MKKIVFISNFLPTLNNIGGPSSLPFLLLQNRPTEYKLYIYSYAINVNIEDVLNKKHVDNLKLLNYTKFSYLIFRSNIFDYIKSVFLFKIPSAIKFRLDKDIIKEIKELNPDIIYLYPHYLFDLSKDFNCKIIITGPDCSTLKFERIIGFSSFKSIKYLIINIYFYLLSLKLEKDIGSSQSKLHLVGKDDIERYKEVNSLKQSNVFYCNHPHNEYKINKSKLLGKSKLEILISSGIEENYKQTSIDLFIDNLINDELLNGKFSFKFIGKGFTKYINLLKNNNFEVSSLEYTSDYVNEIIKSDIHLLLIDIGVGTKGKTLQSLASGLLCIGNKYAFENIEGENNIDFLQINNIKDINNILIDILINPNKYDLIKESGRSKVLKYHNPKEISNCFWNNILL